MRIFIDNKALPKQGTDMDALDAFFSTLVDAGALGAQTDDQGALVVIREEKKADVVRLLLRMGVRWEELTPRPTAPSN